MWSVWLVFFDCAFHSVCPLMEKDKRLMEASWWERLTVGETGLVLMGGAMLSKSLIQFSVDLCLLLLLCSPLLFDPRPSYGGGDEDNGDLLQKVPWVYWYTQYPQPCGRPPLAHASAGGPWTLTGKSRSASFGVTAPFSWVLVPIRFCLCLQESVSPVLCTFWQLYGGLMATSSKRASATPGPLHPEPLSQQQATADLYHHRRPQNTVWLGLCGVSGSSCTQGLFETTECL